MIPAPLTTYTISRLIHPPSFGAEKEHEIVDPGPENDTKPKIGCWIRG